MTMWMVRGESGTLYDEFRDKGVVAVGWAELAPQVMVGASRDELADCFRVVRPELSKGRLISGASQVWRFVNEISIDDWVATYSPGNRTYLLGKVTGDYEYKPEWAESGMPMIRKVQWRGQEVDRDALSETSRYGLGATMTLFQVRQSVAQELLTHLNADSGSNTDSDSTTDEAGDVPADPLEGIESIALERIKDLVSKLGWEEMQELVAGILRAMGYKTQVSPPGPDRGKDIVASPDGFGFENPRIVVEVKHRKGQMGSDAVRSFLGGRHKDDRGLYVSTGGFSKDAYYEADRATVPLALWTMDHLVRALVDHYDNTDAETKRLVPLKRMYLPA